VRLQAGLIEIMQLILALIVACQVESPLLATPCRIEVVEKGSDWPVPLIELRTTNNLRFVTDNAGIIVIDQPELMGREVFFHVEGHGYEVPADGFGYRGVRLTPRAGATLHVEVDRTIIAQRLGRLTGAGQFANAQRVGQETEWRESGVVGSDSVQTAVYRGRHFWLWGDTSLFHYPLGIFHSSAATTELGPLESFKPPLRVKYDYFRNEQGRPRGVAKMPGDGPTWLSAMTTLPDKDGTPHLIASYAKIKPPLDAYEKGLCVWNDESQNFERLQVVWSKSGKVQKSPPMPDGHPTFWTDEAEKPSAFGELWYAESDQPTGPWGSCVKVLSHQNYTFYNPRIHPEFTPDDSPILLFEGTYTQQFADKPHPTARYDYNQILYRLDLNDERLKPAQLRR
jgi:hypothetical protein